MGQSMKSLRGLLISSALALSLVAPARLSLFTWTQSSLTLASHFSFIQPTHAITEADLDFDGWEEEVILQDGVAHIRRGVVTLWSSPPEWQVKQASITDLNLDGQLEVTLLLWRDFAPWPIDAFLVHPGRIQGFHDRHGQSCHLILIGLRRHAFCEIWAGSALVDPLLSFTTADLNGDGRDELIALENHYDEPREIGRTVTVWEWNGFGFSLLSRGPEGSIRALLAVRTPNKTNLLLIQGIPWR